MNILNKTTHFIKPNTILVLNHKSFPYPPFQDYKWNVPDSVDVYTKRKSPFDMKEGGSIEDNVEFLFQQEGIFDIELISTMKNHDATQWTKQTIRVICKTLN
jgi:hypothetical protein